MSSQFDLRILPRLVLALAGAAVVAWIAYKGHQDGRIFWIVTLNGIT
jgi:hypothetical protein